MPDSLNGGQWELHITKWKWEKTQGLVVRIHILKKNCVTATKTLSRNGYTDTQTHKNF